MQATPSPETQTPTSTAVAHGGGAKTGLGTILGAVALVLAVVALAMNFALPGPAGATGPGYTSSSVLHSGQSETGLFSAWGGNGTGWFGDTISFRIPLSADLPSANASFLVVGGGYSSNCTGPGHALPGHLCVYEQAAFDRLAPGSLFYFGPLINPYDGSSNVSQWGFGLYFVGTAEASYSYGTWTVAAP
jgi:hypothetical protein